MHTLRVAFDQSRFIVDNLFEASETNHPEGITHVRSGGQIDSGRLNRQILFAIDDVVAALGFTLKGKPCRKRLSKFTCKVEQPCCIPALEFKLDLAQRQ